ncbi:MAG: helix-turn-helix transcriptional regulator [Woeseiaceae bacterium]|nr:helix-turn-helix transcriptional regulator [Woeseiaceae bacterium]
MSNAASAERTTRTTSQRDQRVTRTAARADDLQVVDWFSRLGWEGAISRLEPGGIEPVHSIDERDGLTLSRIATPYALEFSGHSPATRVTLLIPRGGHDLWVNGRNIGRRGVISLPPGTETLALFRGGGRAIVVTIPARRDDHGTGVRRALTGGGALAALLTSDCPDRAKALQVRGLADELAARSLAADEETNEIAFRIVLKARCYIEQHLGRRIRMTDICEHAATSLSRLERTFRRELNLTPSQYLLAIRLEAVREALEGASDRETSVAHVAHDCGFNHLGRFAAAYRRHFGELPSHTLRDTLPLQA